MLSYRTVSLAAAALLVLGAPNAMPQAQRDSTRPAFHLLEATVDDVRAALLAKRITCHALVALYLKRIEAYDKSGPRFNAIQTVNPRALQEADRLDMALTTSAPLGPLHCVPVLVKDQIETSDMTTTYGSAVFKDFVPQRDATVVKKLKAAGAIVLAKTTMGEFAQGYVSSAAGPIRNAYDPTRNASGSSGGTGAGVAANFATVGIGEDTGGSVRGPAAVGSLIGIRPTVPLVSRFGMLPAKPFSDTIGPITRTVRDAAIVLDAISGFDPDDPVTAYATGQVPSSYTAMLDVAGLQGVRIGVIREPMDARTDPVSDDYKKVRVVTERALSGLKARGAVLVDPVTIPRLKDTVNLYDANVFETESAINRYFAAHTNAPLKTLQAILLSGMMVPSRATALMKTIGRSTEESGYLRFLQDREEARQVVLAVMAENRLDALVYATFDHQPDPIAPDAMTNAVASAPPRGNNRLLSSVLGFPAITVPAGFTVDELPVGIELMGRPFGESMLLRYAYAYEQGTHHRKPPPLAPALRGEP